MTAPAKPKVVHVYRHPYAGLECNDAPEHDNYIRLNGLEYLGEYAPRGPVVSERWELQFQYDDGTWGHHTSYEHLITARRELKERRDTFSTTYRIVHVVRRKVVSDVR